MATKSRSFSCRISAAEAICADTGSYRFRDRHSILATAEYRWYVQEYVEMAIFYDAGKVVPRKGDLDFTGLKSDIGIGLRFHTPQTTVLRFEVARSTRACGSSSASARRSSNGDHEAHSDRPHDSVRNRHADNRSGADRLRVSSATIRSRRSRRHKTPRRCRRAISRSFTTR